MSLTGSRPLSGQFLPLLIALTVLFLLYPTMVELGVVSLYRLVFVAFLIVALWALSRDRRVLIVALALGVPTVIGQLAIFASTTRGVLLTTGSLAFLFLAFTTVVTLTAVLRPGKVTTDKLAGSICVYLLLGLTFAILYSVIEAVQPGAFALPGQIEGHGRGGEYVFIYFSFTTLTTLGYGDIAPLGTFARTLTWMEAVLGQLYLAILIARLVGLHLVHQQNDSRGRSG